MYAYKLIKVEIMMAKDKTGDNINLNDLKSIDFGPNWLNESGTKQNHKLESKKLQEIGKH